MTAKKLTILQVMKERHAHDAKAICEQVVGLGAGSGKTPAASCSAKLYTEAKKGDGLVLRTKNIGEFKLNPKRRVKAAGAGEQLERGASRGDSDRGPGDRHHVQRAMVERERCEASSA